MLMLSSGSVNEIQESKFSPKYNRKLSCSTLSSTKFRLVSQLLLCDYGHMVLPIILPEPRLDSYCRDFYHFSQLHTDSVVV